MEGLSATMLSNRMTIEQIGATVQSEQSANGMAKYPLSMQLY